MKKLSNKSGDRISLWVKIGYGIGNIGPSWIFNLMGIYLIYFFTDVAMIGAYWAGTIFLLSKIWNSVVDPVAGFLVDRTHTRWGSKRPYLFLGPPVVAVFCSLMFASPIWAAEWKVAYSLVILLLLWTSFSFMTIPYNTLLASITRDSHERSDIAGLNVVFALIALLIIGALIKPIVSSFGNDIVGWRMIGYLTGIVTVFFMWITCFTVKERVKDVHEEKYYFKDIIQILKLNFPFIIIAMVMFLSSTVVSIVGAMIIYYFKYILQTETFIPVAFACVFGIAIIMLPLWIFISKKIGKHRSYLYSLLGYGFSVLPLFFIAKMSYATVLPVFIVAGIALSGLILGQWSLISDTVEYSQWKTGHRPEGILFGIYVFMQKAGGAVAGLVVGAGLDLSGYVANIEQSASSLMGIRVLTAIIPFVVLLLCAILISRYPIDASLHKKMCVEIECRGVDTPASIG